MTEHRSDPPQENADTPTHEAPTPREERVSVLRGDRMCVECGYNLTGQPVLREPRYNLLIVRCPECSGITSVQEYPLVGRWPARFTSALALAWMTILTLAMAGVIGAMVGMSIGFSMESTGEYRRFLRQEFNQHLITMYPEADPSALWKLPERFDAWYAGKDAGALLDAAGGWLGIVDAEAGVLLIVPACLAFLAGLMLVLAVIHRKRWSVAVIVSAFATIALTVLALVWMKVAEGPPADAEEAAIRQLGLPLIGCMIVLEWCIALVAVVAGRTIGRAAVRALLPPRFRTALSVLWTTDGLDVPDHDPQSTRWTRGSLSDLPTYNPSGPDDAI